MISPPHLCHGRTMLLLAIAQRNCHSRCVSGHVSPMNQHSGHHTLSPPCPPSSPPLCSKDGVGRAQDGVGTVTISQYDSMTGHASAVAAKLVLVGAGRALQKMSSTLSNASSHGQDQRSSSPSSPPILVSMASPPPRAKSTWTVMPTPLTRADGSSPLSESPPVFPAGSKRSMDAAGCGGGTPLTQGGSFVGKSVNRSSGLVSFGNATLSPLWKSNNRIKMLHLLH